MFDTIYNQYLNLYSWSLTITMIFMWISLSYMDRVHLRERSRRFGLSCSHILEQLLINELFYDKLRILCVRPLCTIFELINGFLEGIENFEAIVLIMNHDIKADNSELNNIESNNIESNIIKTTNDIDTNRINNTKDTTRIVGEESETDTSLVLVDDKKSKITKSHETVSPELKGTTDTDESSDTNDTNDTNNTNDTKSQEVERVQRKPIRLMRKNMTIRNKEMNEKK